MLTFELTSLEVVFLVVLLAAVVSLGIRIDTFNNQAAVVRPTSFCNSAQVECRTSWCTNPDHHGHHDRAQSASEAMPREQCEQDCYHAQSIVGGADEHIRRRTHHAPSCCLVPYHDAAGLTQDLPVENEGSYCAASPEPERSQVKSGKYLSPSRSTDMLHQIVVDTRISVLIENGQRM